MKTKKQIGKDISDNTLQDVKKSDKLSEEEENAITDEPDLIKTLNFFSTSIDESLEKKGIVFLENETDFPGVTLHAKKLVFDIASSYYYKTTDNMNGIEIYINSGGGEIMQFLSLHDAILMAQKFFKTKVITIVNGLAASAAALVLQAGNPRLATKNSYIMIHEISFGLEGKFTNVKDEFNSVKRMQTTAFRIWADKMGISVKELCSMISGKDLYFPAKEAKKIGLIDEII